MTINGKQLTEAQKAQHKELRNAITEAKKISSKQERNAWDSYYTWMKDLDLDTVLNNGFMYNGKPYYVTVRDSLPNARVNAGWTKEQVDSVLFSNIQKIITGLFSSNWKFRNEKHSKHSKLNKHS